MSARLYVAPDGYGDPTIWLDTDTDGQRDEAVMVRTDANAAGFDALAGLVERDTLAAEIARVTPCSCSAQRERAERAEAKVWAALTALDEATDPIHAGGCHYRHQQGETDECNSCTAHRVETALRAVLDGHAS